MQFYSADDYGAYGRAKEESTQREANRFFALAQADAAARERAVASANEADRFAFQAAARDAQLMEDRNRFQLQQALQERDREERRGDVLFNRRLMLGQEGREQARLNLAERRFKADEDAFNKQLELDRQLEGQEGEALAQRYMEIVPQLKSIDEQMEGLRDTDELRRKEAVELGLIVGPKGFDVPSAMVDIAKQQALRAKASEFNNELKRIAELQKAAKDKQTLLLRDKYNLDRSAGRMGAVLTERGLEGRGRIIPFPQVPASAVGSGLPVTVIDRVDGGGLGPVPGATPRSATPPPAARQTDEEFGPPAPVSPIVARQSATQGRPSPARQQIEALGPMTDETFRTALARLTPAERNDAYRTIRALTFKSLGLNPYSEQLRIGESRLFRNPDSYMLDLAQTPEFTTYWKSMDPEEKARILQAALIEADTGGAGRYSRFGIDLPSYGPAGSAQRFE